MPGRLARPTARRGADVAAFGRLIPYVLGRGRRRRARATLRLVTVGGKHYLVRPPTRRRRR